MPGLYILCAFIGIASAAHPDFRPYNVSALAIFHGSDFDQDGILSRQELDQSFVKYDVDHDGRVSRHEYTTFIEQQIPTLSSMAHALYDDYDVSGDHHLDHHDYDMYYAKMDADGDGSVTQQEFVDYWVQVFIRTEHLHGHGHTR